MKLRQLIVLFCVCGVFASLPAGSSAQQTSQSAADAARKTKEQQKPKVKVWTNDNLPTAATVSIVGQTPQQGDSAKASGAESAISEQSRDREQLTSDHDKAAAALDQAKKDLSDAKADLDLAQRNYKLDSDQFYSSPDYANDRQGQAKLDNDRDQISTKQQAADAAQKKVDDLQKQLDALNEKLKAIPNQPKS